LVRVALQNGVTRTEEVRSVLLCEKTFLGGVGIDTTSTEIDKVDILRRTDLCEAHRSQIVVPHILYEAAGLLQIVDRATAGSMCTSYKGTDGVGAHCTNLGKASLQILWPGFRSDDFMARVAHEHTTYPSARAEDEDTHS